MVGSSESAVTIIIPTRGLPARASHILRAIDSVLQQQDVTALPLVIINGTQAESTLVRTLRTRADIRLAELPVANLPAALAAGRRLVTTPLFAELDDDDVLLPNALALRLRLLEDDPTLVAVVSNGILRGAGADRPAIEDTARAAADPLLALCSETWLSPGAGLFRTAGVPADLFDRMPQFLEWTYLAVQLASTRRVAFLPQATFIRHLDTPQGVWNSAACMLGLPTAIQQLLTTALPLDLHRAFTRRLADACHGAAAAHLDEGRWREALTWHLRCLRSGSGWRYWPFMRNLLLGLMRA